MLRCVALVRIDVSEELSASIIRVTRIGDLLVTANVIPTSPILVTLMMEAIHSAETSVLIRATGSHIPKDGILHSHLLEDIKILHSINLQGSVAET
jgi:hypothetical protein